MPWLGLGLLMSLVCLATDCGCLEGMAGWLGITCKPPQGHKQNQSLAIQQPQTVLIMFTNPGLGITVCKGMYGTPSASMYCAEGLKSCWQFRIRFPMSGFAVILILTFSPNNRKMRSFLGYLMLIRTTTTL
ncbi:hypothetical protein K438DRAFT_1765240 [Mycena galopus ATCC 62051]|nr:hypothetical protein K438DRAFT_1765240 [Mycena galopus ATCC 62051]